MKAETKLKLSNKNKKLFFSNFYESKNFQKWNYFFLFYSNKLLYKHANIKMKKDDTSFPQMGEEGCGSRNPTRSLLTSYNIWCV